MNDADLRAAWQSGSMESPSGEEVLMDVKQRAQKLNRGIFRRDLIETVATLFAWSVFALMALVAPGVVPKVALLLGTAFLVSPVLRLHRERRRHRDVDASAPMKAHLEREIERVDGQIDLLRRVKSWYVLPLAIGATLFMAGLGFAVPSGGTLLRMLVAAGTVLFSAALFAGVGIAIGHANRRAVETDLVPLRRDLEQALRGLEAS